MNIEVITEFMAWQSTAARAHATLGAMATVHVTPNLQRHVPTETATARGATVREVLADYFRQWPALRGYVLQDAGALRTHMTVFVNGSAIQDRERLSDPVPEDGEVYIMQALSGG